MVLHTLRPPLPALRRAYERYGRRLPGLAELLLTVLLAQATASLVWKLVPTSTTGAWRAPQLGAATANPAAAQGPQVQLIASSHLFGEYQAPADPVLTELSSAPDTRLDLTLLGILSATTERGSRALISASSGEEKPYAIGDDVARGVSLQAIFSDRVILSRAGQLETLRLDKNAPAAPLQGGYGSDAAREGDGGDGGDGSEPTTAAMLTSIREQVLTDPSRASDYIRVQPASSGGQLRGYRIYPGKERAAFTAAGLRPGDLVTQVNGIQLNDANTALQMLGQLSQSSSVSMVIERGGQPQTVNLNFN